MLTWINTELEYQLRDSESKILLVSQDRVDVGLKAANQAGLAVSQVYIFHDPAQNITTSSKSTSWTELWRSPNDSQSWSWKQITSLDEAKSTTAIINYSSG
jgi:4-coumarate--CoA ligase